MTSIQTLSFKLLYTNYYRKSYLFAKSYVHDEMVAEDIVSDVLIKLWEKIKEDHIEHFEGLLIAMIKNKSLDYLKHQYVKLEAFSSISAIYKRDLDIRVSTLEACDPDELLSSEIQVIISQTLASLPEQTREIFELSRYFNKSNKEIAKHLNISIKTIEYHITKALKLLRTNLRDYLPFIILYI